jgi:gliding motility-associated-like protein
LNNKYFFALLVFFGLEAKSQVSCNGDFFSAVVTNSDSTFEFLDVLPLPNGDVITAGYYNSDTADPILVKFNPNGQTIWQKRLAIPNRAYVFQLEPCSDGNILLGGGIQGLSYGSLLVKLDTAGNLIWRTHETYNDLENCRAEYVREDDAGNIYTFSNFIENNKSFQDRFAVRKYTSGGQLLWSRMIGGTGLINTCWMYDVVFSNGAFFLAGRWYTGLFNEGMLMKINASDGSYAWTRLYNLNGKETTLDGILPAGNGFVLCGKNGLNAADSTVLFQIDVNGQLLSTHSFAFPVAEKPYTTDAAGNIFFASGFRKSESTDSILIAKLNVQQGFVWANAYVTTPNFFPRVSSLELSGDQLYFGGGAYRNDNKIFGHVSRASVNGEAACPYSPVSIVYRTATGTSRDTSFFSVNKPVVNYSTSLTVANANVASRSACASGCSIVAFDRDAVSLCSLRDTLHISFSKNAECLTAVDLSFSSTLYRLVSKAATSASFVALKPGTSTIHASITSLCGIVQDSIKVSYAVPDAIDVNDLPALAGRIQHTLQAPAGFSFIGDDGARKDSFVVRRDGLNRLRLVDPCGNIVMDTVKYYPLRPDRLVNGSNLQSNAMVTYANAFSPNGDGRNDLYKPTVRAALSQYRFTIFNRLGQVVFSSTAIDKYWDGSGLPAGTYFFKCAYTLPGGQAYFDNGTVTLIR